MKLALFSFLSFFLSLSLHGVSIDELESMTSEEKLSFFLQKEGRELDHQDDFIPALLIGLRDRDVEVQRVAASMVGLLIPMLQGMKANGEYIPFDLSGMPELQATLVENLSNADSGIRTASVKALAYSQAPSSEIESSLIQSFQNENEPRVKAKILKSLVDSGYESESLERTLIEAMRSSDPQVISSAAKGIEVLTPDGGLEVVVEHLSIDNIRYLHTIIWAIAAYGDAAKPYLPALNQILDNPRIGGTIVSDLEGAVRLINNPSSKQVKKGNKPVNLYVYQEPAVEEVAEVIAEITAPEAAIEEEPANVVVAKPVEEDIEPSSNWWLWLIGAVVVVGGVIVLRSRK